MQTALKNAKEWAMDEFAGADLGDVRRSKRLIRVAAALSQSAHGTLPGSFDGWSQLKAAYRLLQTPEITYQKIIEPHAWKVRSACRSPGEYLLIEDSSSVDFSSHRAAEEFGRIGDDGGRGLYIHSTLALAIHGWSADQQPDVTAVGLFAQECWARGERTRCAKEKKAARLKRARESQRWAAVFSQGAGPPPGVRWTYIADRESDIYEVFERCGGGGVDFIIRASQPRALADEGGSVFQAVAAAPVVSRFSLALRSRPQQVKRAKHKGQQRRIRRPKQPARTVTLEVRSCSVRLRAPWRPGREPAQRPVNVVEVLEVDPPEGAEPIRWVLLSTWPVQTAEQAMRVVKVYACRWLIEEYHKALKTGTGIENSQLSTPQRIQSLLGVLAVVAVRLVNLKLLAQAHPQQPVDVEQLGSQALAILAAKYGSPEEGWTYQAALTAIARLGGFLARKSDGRPGWITIWRGWQKLIAMVDGLDLMKGEKCG